MKTAALALCVALGLGLVACAPQEEVTPLIPVMPGQASRICSICLGTLRQEAAGCTPELHDACAELYSDLQRVSVVLVPEESASSDDAGDDAAFGEDAVTSG
jgi:hypothetical protein